MEAKRHGEKCGAVGRNAMFISSVSELSSNENKLEIVRENVADDDPHVSQLLADENTSEDKALIETDDGFCRVDGRKQRRNVDLQQALREWIPFDLVDDSGLSDLGKNLYPDGLSSVFEKRAPVFEECPTSAWPSAPLNELTLGNKGVPGQQSNCSFPNDVKLKRGGFYVLDSLESDSFDCDGDDMQQKPHEIPNANLGKRNRQISTDSSSSTALDFKESSKTMKKPKKKDRKKQNVDEEIDKILAEFNKNSKTSASKGSQNDEFLNATDAPEVTKCKKKNRRKQNLVEFPKNASSYGQLTVSHQPDLRDERTEAKVQPSKKTAVETPCDKCSQDSVSSVDGSEVSVKSLTATDSVEVQKHRKRPGKTQLAAIRAALQKAKENEERLAQEEMAKQKKAEEMERARLEKLKLEQERKEKKKQKEKIRKERLKAEGKFLTKSQKIAKARVEAALSAWREHGIEIPNAAGSDAKVPRKKSQAKLCSHGASGGGEAEVLAPKNESVCAQKNEVRCEGSQKNCPVFPPPGERLQFAQRARARTKSESDLPGSDLVPDRKLSRSSNLHLCNSAGDKKIDSVFRSPVVCVLGHVDTGKTKILDKIRKTHVQDNEAGGITQQIGATMVPIDALKDKCSLVKGFSDFDLQLPGLLIIDTPGHESFRNLRSRGSSLCDIAVLVVDIMHGLEQQTLESIDLLKQRKTPFVVALNKVDRLYKWETNPTQDVVEVIRQQETVTLMEFEKRCQQIIAEFANQGLNAVLYYENNDPRSYVSLVPVSAVSGDGMGNLLAVICQLCQKMLAKRLTFSEDLEATVLEVKASAGLGTTIDVILVNGRLRETDTIVLAGQDGPIVTQIRSLLMPHPLRELRVKNPYVEFKTVKGAQGVKLAGKDLDKAIAGLPLFVSKNSDDQQTLKETVTRLFRQTINSIKLSERGVYVQASTLGSLEALLTYLKTSNIPYSGVKVGPVVKKDVIKASVMLEHDIQYAAILAFDVKVERDAHELADHLGIKIFQADIIYHLFDNFISYRDELQEKKINELKKFVVFPCKLNVLPQYVFSVRNPISIGVHVSAGVLRIGTPLCAPSRSFLDIGHVTAIEAHNKQLDCAKEGDDVCIKIESLSEDSPKVYGKHFDDTDLLVSKISRQTIDVCKEYYRDDLQKSDWQLMVELKKLFMIT